MLKKLRTNALTLGTFALIGIASIVYLSAGVAVTSGHGYEVSYHQATPTPTPAPSPTPKNPSDPTPSPVPSPTDPTPTPTPGI